MKAIDIHSLTKRYGKSRGVENLSFDIASGEVFGYLGPNGSGKTTTIRCLMGLLRPTSGDCYVLGRQIMPGRATNHSRIGYLPGDFRIWPGRTARKSLKLMASLGNSDNVNKRRNELADRLNLDLDRKVKALSKGNRQKIGIIFAFQHQPEVLILDEPTIGLDPLIRQVVMELIREAAHQGATVLLSSHDLSEIAAVCERAAILREGRLVELSSISQIVQQGQRQLKVWFIKDGNIVDVTKELPEGIRIIHHDDKSLHISYQGTSDKALKWLAKFPVDRITTPQTSLEDAFIQYYQKGDGHE